MERETDGDAAPGQQTEAEIFSDSLLSVGDLSADPGSQTLSDYPIDDIGESNQAEFGQESDLEVRSGDHEEEDEDGRGLSQRAVPR